MFQLYTFCLVSRVFSRLFKTCAAVFSKGDPRQGHSLLSDIRQHEPLVCLQHQDGQRQQQAGGQGAGKLKLSQPPQKNPLH